MFHLRGGKETLRSLFNTAEIALKTELALDMHDLGLSSPWYPNFFSIQNIPLQ